MNIHINVVFFSILPIFLSFSLGAQTKADINQVIEKYLIPFERLTHPQAIFASLSRDLKNTGPEYFDLNQQDSEKLLKLLELDRSQIQRKALEPFMEEICSRINDGKTDIQTLSAIFMQAIQQEEYAISNALDSILSTLSDDGIRKIREVINTRSVRKVYWEIDWHGLAAQEPSFVKETLEEACERFSALVEGKDFQLPLTNGYTTDSSTIKLNAE